MLSPLSARSRSGAAISTLAPLNANASRRAVSNVFSMPAPIGGWNARDALPAMAVTDAIQLDNFIPDTGGVKIRKGKSEHATGAGTFVESLMEYNAPGGTQKLFAASVDKIYDATSGGAASEAVTSLSNGRFQHTMFATSGGNYLVACNGADDVLNYDGSSWATPTITGVTSANLINVAAHMNRLWFVEKDTLNIWYLATASVSGAATKLALGPLCKLGGSLLAMCTWTRDGGAGIDDLAVFVTTKGEALIYSGSDPSSATTWALQGIFRIPEPVGRRCFVKTGADIGLITSQGVLPLSAILPLASSGAAKVAATDKISGAFSTAYNGSSDAFGWQIIEAPKDRLLIINVPLNERVTAHQYVMNAQTGAWCRFTGFNAGCWSLLGDELYWGGHDGTIWKYSGSSDDGDEIDAVSVSAFSNFRVNSLKQIVMARPMIYGPDGYIPLVALRKDYDLGTVNYQATASVSGGAIWDEAVWDEADWGIAIAPTAIWQSVGDIGTVFSVGLAVAVTDQFQLNAVDLMFETGGFL